MRWSLAGTVRVVVRIQVKHTQKLSSRLQHLMDGANVVLAPGRIDGAETGVLPDPSVGAPMGPGQREKIGEFEMGPDIRRLARRLLDGEGREVDAHDAFDRAGLRQGTDVVSKAAAGHED